MEWARETAASQLPALAGADHLNSLSANSLPGNPLSPRTPAAPPPVGSNNQQRPSWLRAPAVAMRTSGLVDVDTTAPGAAATDGVTVDVVLPERGGPRISAERSVSTSAQPFEPSPR